MVGTQLSVVTIVFSLLLLLQMPQEGLFLLLMPQQGWRQDKEQRGVDGLGGMRKGSSEWELKKWRQGV